MSEQAEQISGEPGSIRIEPIVPHSPDASTGPVVASAETPVSAEAPGLVPEQDAAAEAPEMSAPKVEDFKVDDFKADDFKADASKVDAPKADKKPDAPRMPGKVMITSSAERAWAHDDAGPEVEPEQPSQSMFGKRRISALAVVVTLAAIAGAFGGAMATVSLQHFAGTDVVSAAPAANSGFDATVARIDADIVALKAGVEHASKMSVSQFNKTSERLDKVEKAQAEPAAKLAKLSEAVEKLHAIPAVPAPVAAAAPAPKEVTGSVTPPAAAPKVEVARLPTIDSWVLREVANGGALVEGRQGIFEVYAGDIVPGLGRIDAIRKQDGRWVVVTSKGLVVSR